ncbi:NADP-dependent oxidoreductase [Nocardia donostiensis]|uniref:Alcohol dehydrogenase n=1 Tax=Nocardia donostiensis TaxID=1538463 RepID=A0A1W0AVU8_9NOCA|nr:NADP-dependent oxidoreductase [Nocardia donostiensis]ONM47404.1 alcohol dehydrogenase [Nocardia donostiensis]OQS14371.1 alcohol dehydrogenase [Nocardia donostiensis]OQS24129.1 alcohol dehydrogenase [Nocardia donostiensis]
MRAATYDRYTTDLADVQVRNLPTPKVFPGSVLIEVRAAGVNPVDWKVMSGGLDSLLDAVFPVIPGWDVAGAVVDTGVDTPEFVVGDEVLAYARKDVLHEGTFAELVAVSAAHVARKPADLPWEQAGALPLAGGTALRTLDALEVSSGDTVLIHAAAGGVGSLGVQIAKASGARVLGTASPRNHDFLRELGAEPVEYGDGLADRVRELAPNGVDAVADFVGGQLDTTLRVLAEGGRHASTVDNTVAEHGGHIIWVRPDGTQTQRLADLAAKGDLTVPISATFGLDEVPDAFAASQKGHTRGKSVIVL